MFKPLVHASPLIAMRGLLDFTVPLNPSTHLCFPAHSLLYLSTIHPSSYLPTHPPNCPLIHPLIHPSSHLLIASMHTLIHSSSYPPTCPSLTYLLSTHPVIHLSTYPYTQHLFYTYLTICPTTHLSFHPSIHPHTYISIHLSNYTSFTPYISPSSHPPVYTLSMYPSFNHAHTYLFTRSSVIHSPTHLPIFTHI